MKSSLLLLVLIISCAKESSSSRSVSMLPLVPEEIEEISDPLVTGTEQEQTRTDFRLIQNYNGLNLVLNYNSKSHLGIIRVRGKDAEKLHKFMALSTIKTSRPPMKNEIEAKVGRHVICRPDTCWVYIDYKNGVVNENQIISSPAKAPRIIFTYRSDRLELKMFKRAGRITIEGMDAKALFTVMQVPENLLDRREVVTTKSGDNLECTKAVKPNESEDYSCSFFFNHRSGAID